MNIQAADLFCGAGGTSTGFLLATQRLNIIPSLVAINHWKVAIDSHTANHPGVRHLCQRLDTVQPRDCVADHLHVLMASPECTHHSNARGGKPKQDQSRASAWHVVQWVSEKQPDEVLVENVREFERWGPLDPCGKPIPSKVGTTYQAWLAAIESCGYNVETKVLRSSDYGDATTRQRLYVRATRQDLGRPTWPDPTHVGREKPARDIIDWSIVGTPIHERDRPLAPSTMRRIEAGLRKFGGHEFIPNLSHSGRHQPRSADAPLPTLTTARGGGLGLCQPFVIGQQSCAAPRSVDEPLPTIATAGAISLVEPFIVKYYGNGGVQPINRPLDTVTTKPKFGLVEPTRIGVRFRMLQPHELAAAMGFPAGYQFTGTKADQCAQIGNAVTVNTAAALCGALLSRYRVAKVPRD